MGKGKWEEPINYNSNEYALQFICVCHTASATPHNAARINITHSCSSVGSHVRSITMRTKWIVVPDAKMNVLPVFLATRPQTSENNALVAP